MTPIDITPCEGGYRVINGRRRVFATKRIGRETIRARIISKDRKHSEIKEIKLSELVINWEWPV